MTIDKDTPQNLPIKVLHDKEHDEYFVPVINPATEETLGGIRPDGETLTVDEETGVATAIIPAIIGSDTVEVTTENNVIQISTKSYEFIQTTPSNTWVIKHNLNKIPNVILFDTAGTEFKAERHYDNLNQVTILMNSATSGKAYLN